MKLGRIPIKHTKALMLRALRMSTMFDTLGTPPKFSPGYSALVEKLTSGDWGIDGNDSVGDCTCADVSHRLMIWTAPSGAMVVPTAAETLALYSAITGYNPSDPSTDQGSDLATVADYLDKTGYKISNAIIKEDGYGLVAPSNLDHIKWAITLFGCVPIGIQCPQSALDQFDAGKEWDVSGDGTIAGGHDVLLVEYQPEEPCWSVITWGRRWPVTSAFLAKYLDEVVPVVSHEFVQTNSTAPSGIDLAQMLSDLKEIN